MRGLKPTLAANELTFIRPDNRGYPYGWEDVGTIFDMTYAV
jgi:hypothetical protein